MKKSCTVGREQKRYLKEIHGRGWHTAGPSPSRFCGSVLVINHYLLKDKHLDFAGVVIFVDILCKVFG
jgi:hypothetical protein